MTSARSRILANVVTTITLLSPAAIGRDELTDERLADSIQRGVQWVLQQQNDAGHWEKTAAQPEIRGRQVSYFGGNTALACLALLYARIPPEHPQLAKGLKFLMEAESNSTYVIGLRCHVFALAPPKQFQKTCQRDLGWLLRSVGDASDPVLAGTYDYAAPIDPRDHSGTNRYDNSNSQYGLLGVWAAAEAGHPVPDSYWQLIEQHWLGDQNDDGGWEYQGRSHGSYGSMTAAGVASLYVVLDQRYTAHGTLARNEATRQADQVLQAIDRGLDWLGRYYRPDSNPPDRADRWLFYYLYGVERVGHASGRKYFNERDWFREGAKQLLAMQESDGGWPGGFGIPRTEYIDDRMVNTAFALMFLTRGSGPVLFNKLERTELTRAWSAYPRDAAHLARYAERTLERHVNWQVVSLTNPVETLHDAPVLYVSNLPAWQFSDEEVATLRTYLEQGGMILATGSGEVEKSEQVFRALIERLCPQVTVREIDKTHPLFTQRVHVAIDKPPTLLEARNGIRPLLLFCPQPLHQIWNANDVEAHGQLFALGTNIYLYATDRSVAQTRLTTYILPNASPPAGAPKIRLARVQYDGAWNPEPFGWEQLRRDLAGDGTADLQVAVGVRFDDPRLEAYDIAHVTGTGQFKLSEQEREGLKRFLQRGGTLLADAAGGREDFDATFRARVRELFEPNTLRPVPIDHELWTGPPHGEDLRSARTRRSRSGTSTGASVGHRGGPRLEALALDGRLAIIYSPIDLSAGMVGQPIFDCPGVRPPEARKLVRNMLLFAAQSQKKP